MPFPIVPPPALVMPVAFKAGEYRQYTFANEKWKIVFSPETLQLDAYLPDQKEPLRLSEPLAKRLLDYSSASSKEGGYWRFYPSENGSTEEPLGGDADSSITVSLRLTGDTLRVKITSQSVEDFTFPRIGEQTGLKAWILPFGEGNYVPAKDNAWRQHLLQTGAFNTTEGLSFPAWGLDFGRFGITYLLTNPYNNEFQFEEKGNRLFGALTHQFTKNTKRKEYEVQIALGTASPLEVAKRYRTWLQNSSQFVTLREKIQRVPEAGRLQGAAHVYLWGDGVSNKMLDRLKQSGISRLWLGVDGWSPLRKKPEVIRKAKELGYLFAPYDSYHSIHAPSTNMEETWETAQFDKALYETGAIVRRDGKKRVGFQGKGYLLSPLVAQPYVEKRVSDLMRQAPCNSWFIDCDAFEEVFEDYSPLHPATQAQDAQARLKRMAWIRDTYHLVIGSEGGSAYAASTLHYAQGIVTGVIGFGDPDLKTPKSPYFLGRYAPPAEPQIFFKQVPLKPRYYPFYFDPTYRLPLYETVFHDSIVATHHWSAPTLKFTGIVKERELMELLYNVPPLYHLNQREFAEHGTQIATHCRDFEKLHRELGLLPLTGFQWLTEDHRVQKTTFGGKVELVANFRNMPFVYKGNTLPGRSLLKRDLSTGKVFTITP